MERKIGEIFEYNGEWYQCVKGLYCDNCAFVNDNCEDRERITLREKLTKQPTTGFCNSEKRNDRKSVIFKKLEKVGEPYVGNNGTFQSYKLAMPIYGDIPDQIIGFTTTEVVIKQTKEDMEEKNNAKHSNSEKIGKNLKPFDLQKARKGKPVCTRDGRKARIICFDRIDSTRCNLPIVALVQCEGTEVLQLYHDDGKCDVKADLDLMMLPEKKEGWVNVYYDRIDGITFSKHPYPSKEEAIKNVGTMSNRIDTVKISWEE